eukprot:CAMPEP_0181310148 /NCGR_PEP_ID=MMETSP1101-20121128/12427_1 /TAXON_ID=46948 /ORGANISM="Rhodomonas abbreviata, Strain Caron Lab Isolate" /LENGTH=938 /DNA_ID=CAMNT_0023416749 /DNA_START=207 /DNA_END=3020 /DNA_ORIENTATION=-
MSSWSPPAGSAAWKSYISTSVSSAVSGAGAVATEMLGAVSSSVPRETSLSQWMPPSVQAYLPGRDPSKTAGSDRDKVVSVTFDVDIGSPAHPQFLCMCFRNGFQVWEVQDTAEGSTQANRETQPLREVLSVRQGYTRLVKCLPSVPVPEGSLLSGQQPVLGVVSGDEVGDLNMLKIFSLKSNRYIHQLKFHGDVLGVVCNRKWLVVVLKNQLLVYSLEHLALQHTLNTFPNQTPTGVVALGARWLAYASNQPLLSHGEAPTMTYGSPLFDVGVGVAGTMASGAKQLGEMGLRTLNSYLSSSPTLSEPVPAEPALEYAGSVMIRDMDTQQVLHHFRAHDAPLGIMKFDPSGLLLVTAAVDGRNINLFEINSHAGKGGRSAPKHLYKLVRGVTSSAIQDIAFSIDTRWVAVTSNRGTAHLYPINPDGSPASVDTHVPSPAANAAWPIYPLSASYAAVPSPPITVFAVARIRTCDGGAAAAAAAAGLESAAGCARFVVPGVSTVYTQFPPAVSAVFVVSSDGVLARYHLRPYPKAEPEAQAETLHLEIECQGTFDICRRSTWNEQRCPAERLASWAVAPKLGGQAKMAGCMPEWVSHVEIYTHERGEDSVWASRMFQFKSFSPQAGGVAGSGNVNFEQIPCVHLGGQVSPSPDGCYGEEDLEEYFVVQTCPKPGVVSMQSDGLPNTQHLASHFETQEPAAGVYGGMPAAAAAATAAAATAAAAAAASTSSSSAAAAAGSRGAGAGAASNAAMMINAMTVSPGREPAGAANSSLPLPSLSKSRSIDIITSSSSSVNNNATNNAAWKDDIFGSPASGEGGLLDLDDWDDDGGIGPDVGQGPGSDSDGARAGRDAGSPSENASPGLAASSMMLFDDDLDGAGVSVDARMSAAGTRGKEEELPPFNLLLDVGMPPAAAAAAAAAGGGGGKKKNMFQCLDEDEEEG